MNTLLERLLFLQEQSGLKGTTLAKELGIAPSSFTEWNKGKSKPSLDAVVKFSDYFNVSLDWIVFGDDSRYGYSPDERKLLQKYNSLPSSHREKIDSYIDGMCDAYSIETQ